MGLVINLFIIGSCLLRQASYSLHLDKHFDVESRYQDYEFRLCTKTPYRFIENVNDTEIHYSGRYRNS